MSKEDSQGGYRPLYKVLTLGANEYAILDRELASERAKTHFDEAMRLITKVTSPESEADIARINHELLIAVDFGCKAAPYQLGLRYLEGKAEMGKAGRRLARRRAKIDEALVFFKIAAERGHAEAAYRLGISYAGLGAYIDLERIIKVSTSKLDAVSRCELAVRYLDIAIEQEHPEAIETLVLAYAYGRGYVEKNSDKFFRLCTRLIQRGNQAVALGFGAWLAGMTVEGEQPLEDAVTIPHNTTLALDYLLMAARGTELEIAQHALFLICRGLERGVWEAECKQGRLKAKLNEDALNGNQPLAFYLTWYSLPLEKRMIFPSLMKGHEFPQFEMLVKPSEENAIYYLEASLKGCHADVTKAARAISAQVFNGYIKTLHEVEESTV